MITAPYRAIRGKRRRRRSEKAQLIRTLASCAKMFRGGFESDAGKRFVEAMTDEARARGKPLGGGPLRVPDKAVRALLQMARTWRPL